jgi:hypothetical protein
VDEPAGRGMQIACGGVMRTRVGAVGLILFGALSLFPTRAESPLRASPMPARADTPLPALPSVTVEHDYLRIAPRVVAPTPSNYRRISAPRVVTPEQKSARGLFARAARAVLGDGRHRPEPFPRPHR